MAMLQLRSGTYNAFAVGEPGPRGPRGPRGPKGANITKEEMFEEFRALISDIATRKLILAADPRCTEFCVSNLEGNDTGPSVRKPLFENGHGVIAPKMLTSFMWELEEELIIPRRSLVELQKYIRPFATGSFERGIGESKSTSGRFLAPRTGFYTFFARIHLELTIREMDGYKKDLFSVMLCIDAICKENVNLETISGFGPGHKMTISVSGMLHLEEKQYVSVWIDNDSRQILKVLEGSQFSGSLSGI